MNTLIPTVSFDSGVQGPSLLILGAIHGNEICGPIAIDRWIQQIEQKSIVLLSGKVTFVPVCNPKAYKEKARFIDHNLNRIFGSREKVAGSYEHDLLCKLEQLILEHDVLLDIHSMTSASDCFAFNDDISNQEEVSLCHALGFEYVVGGWPELYGSISGGTTCEFACQHKKTAVTVECYSHNDERAPQKAFDAIGCFLSFFGVIEGYQAQETLSKSKYVLMKHIIRKEKQGTFSQSRSNGDLVVKNQLLASYDDGEKVFSEIDGIIIMPNEGVVVGEEWMYLGTLS